MNKVKTIKKRSKRKQNLDIFTKGEKLLEINRGENGRFQTYNREKREI